MATAVVERGNDLEVHPGWPASGEHHSVLIKYRSELRENRVEVAISFLAPEEVADVLDAGLRLMVMEGPRVVATLVITEVLS